MSLSVVVDGTVVGWLVVVVVIVVVVVVVAGCAKLEVLLISDHGIVMGVGDPLMEGIVVVTSMGLNSDDFIVDTPAMNSSAGEAVTLAMADGAKVVVDIRTGAVVEGVMVVGSEVLGARVELGS